MRRFITVILLCVTALVSNAQTELKNGVVVDKGAQKIVSGIISRIKADTPFSFAFTYNVAPKGEKAESGKGTFLSNGGSYRIECSQFNDYCNGKSVWHYVKGGNEVELSDLEDGNSMFNFTKLISQYSSAYRPKMIRVEKCGGVNCNVIDLYPKKASSINKVRLYSNASNNRLVKMQILIKEGGSYTYTFSNYKAKVTVSSSDFTFPKAKFPKVKTVDLR